MILKAYALSILLLDFIENPLDSLKPMLFLHHGFMWRQNELLQYPVHPSDSLWARRWRSSCGTGGGLAFLANGSSRLKDEDQDEHGDRGDGDD